MKKENRNNKSYSEKLQDPRWQRKRLEIMHRDDFRCIRCGSGRKTLHVHHKKYLKGKEPWEYTESNFQTLCVDCHKNTHESPSFQPEEPIHGGFNFEELIEKRRSEGKMEVADDRVKVVRECLRLLARMTDPVHRDMEINTVSTACGITSSTVRSEVGRMIRIGEWEQKPSSPMPRCVSYLCYAALKSKEAQRHIRGFTEDLDNARKWIEGIKVIEDIINGHEISPSLRDHIETAHLIPPSDEPHAISQTVNMMNQIVLQKRDAAIKCALKEKGLSLKRYTELLNESKEVSENLRSGLDQKRRLYTEGENAEGSKPWLAWKA